MQDILFVFVGVVVFASFLFFGLVLSMRGAHARIRYEKIRRELKEQGKYEEWASANRMLLTAKAILRFGVFSGLPGSLFFFWQGSRQTGLLFLGIFAICLVVSVPINWILYNKIYKDLN